MVANHNRLLPFNFFCTNPILLGYHSVHTYLGVACFLGSTGFCLVGTALGICSSLDKGRGYGRALVYPDLPGGKFKVNWMDRITGYRGRRLGILNWTKC